MRTLATRPEELRTQAQSYCIQNNGSQIDVYQYYNHGHRKHQYVVEIKSPIIEKDNFYLLIKNKELKLIVSEIKEINRPLYAHHNTRQIFEKNSYECLRNFTIKLPMNSNLYMEQHSFEPELNLLKVTLREHVN